jgi:hypothetical protein
VGANSSELLSYASSSELNLYDTLFFMKWRLIKLRYKFGFEKCSGRAVLGLYFYCTDTRIVGSNLIRGMETYPPFSYIGTGFEIGL